MQKDFDFNLKDIILKESDNKTINNNSNENSIEDIIYELKEPKFSKQLSTLITTELDQAINQVLRKTNIKKKKLIEILLRKALGLPPIQ